MRLFSLFIVLLLQIAFQNISFSQDSIPKQKAIYFKQLDTYIYNFTKYINWESEVLGENFIIGVLGADQGQLIDALRESYKTKTIKGLNVKVKHFKSLTEVTNTDILYVNENTKVTLRELLPIMYANNSLLISEGYDFGQSMINFIDIDNEFHFEINEGRINSARLLVDNSLLSFSIQSTADWQLLYDKLQEESSTVRSQELELESLGLEISSLSDDIDAKENQLKSMLAVVEEKKKLLEGQNELIKEQSSEIEDKSSNLSQLDENIRDQLKINEEKIKIFEIQEIAITDQTNKLKMLENTLTRQHKEIAKRDDQITLKNNTLNTQKIKIKNQRITLYSILGLMAFAIFFIFFMYRSNKRRKESEEKLLVKNVQLAMLNDSLDSFTYRVSHDLKAPVINIKNMLGMLNDYLPEIKNPMVPQIIANINLSSTRLETTLGDMLDLTRIERVEELKSLFVIKTTINELVKDYKDKILKINGILDLTELDDKEIYASEIELTSVLQNLITNSIKYRSPKRNLKVKISTVFQKNKCILTYSDNGIGIDLDKFRGKLFNMFERFTSDNSIEGTGVGMYIIKKLVEKNKGDLKISGGLDKGLTYQITLPMKK